MANIKELVISKVEYDTLNKLRGLNQSVQYMVSLGSLNEDNSFTLIGNPQIFDRLAINILEKINNRSFELNELKNLKTLYFKIAPEFLEKSLGV